MSETPLTITEVRAIAFVDIETRLLSRYAELFPNWVWTDSITAIDLMAGEITSLRDCAKNLMNRPEDWQKVDHCICANRGADLMTGVCDCVSPTFKHCECHDPSPPVDNRPATSSGYPDYSAIDPEPENTCANPKSLYDIPPGCICLGDGLMGMKCTATKHARLREFGTDGREMPADACHVKNADTRLQAETSLSHIFGEIARRRESQDFKWGGPAHDDTHKLPEWVAFAHTYLCRAQIAGWNTRLTGDYDASLDFEKQMIHVAALAVASIQSSRRKRNG